MDCNKCINFVLIKQKHYESLRDFFYRTNSEIDTHLILLLIGFMPIIGYCVIYITYLIERKMRKKHENIKKRFGCEDKMCRFQE